MPDYKYDPNDMAVSWMFTTMDMERLAEFCRTNQLKVPEGMSIYKEKFLAFLRFVVEKTVYVMEYRVMVDGQREITENDVAYAVELWMLENNKTTLNKL
jgi:hypothetical protein